MGSAAQALRDRADRSQEILRKLVDENADLQDENAKHGDENLRLAYETSRELIEQRRELNALHKQVKALQDAADRVSNYLVGVPTIDALDDFVNPKLPPLTEEEKQQLRAITQRRLKQYFDAERDTKPHEEKESDKI